LPLAVGPIKQTTGFEFI